MTAPATNMTPDILWRARGGGWVDIPSPCFVAVVVTSAPGHEEAGGVRRRIRSWTNIPNQDTSASAATSWTVLGRMGATASMRAGFDIQETVAVGLPNPTGDSFDSDHVTLPASCGRVARASVSCHGLVEAFPIDADPDEMEPEQIDGGGADGGRIGGEAGRRAGDDDGEGTTG